MAGLCATWTCLAADRPNFLLLHDDETEEAVIYGVIERSNTASGLTKGWFTVSQLTSLAGHQFTCILAPSCWDECVVSGTTEVNCISHISCIVVILVVITWLISPKKWTVGWFVLSLQHISSRRHKDRVAGKPSKPKYSPYNKQQRSSVTVNNSSKGSSNVNSARWSF